MQAGDREIRAFDDGELWLDDDASPPASPAGWYVRRRKASHPVWIGPFASEAAAADATLTGDPLRDARRRLELWARKNIPAVTAEPEDGRTVEAAPEPLPPLSSPSPEEGATPVAPDAGAKDVAETPKSPAPEPGEGEGGGGSEPVAPRPRRRRTDPRQIDLPF